MKSLDVSRLSRIVLQRIPQFLDAGGESPIAYHAILPYHAQQLLLADELAGVLCQGEQQLGGFQGQFGDLTRAQQFARLDIEPKRPEAELRLVRHAPVPRFDNGRSFPTVYAAPAYCLLVCTPVGLDRRSDLSFFRYQGSVGSAMLSVARASAERGTRMGL